MMDLKLKEDIRNGIVNHIINETLITTASASLLGALVGARNSALQYTAEHSHRKPTTRNGWYKYHRHKNYSVMLGGIVNGFKWMKIGGLCGLFFCLDSGIDAILGKAEGWSGCVAGGILGGGFGLIKRLGFQQCKRAVFGGAILGGLYGVSSLLKCYTLGYTLDECRTLEVKYGPKKPKETVAALQS